MTTMWKSVFLMTFAAVLLDQATASGGAESLPFHGYLPSEMIKALAPEADNHPNDVYQHLPVRRPVLLEDQVVIYPHHLGFEYGQDPERKIYEVHSAKELAAAHSKHGKQCKHDKHGKHSHDHAHEHAHHGHGQSEGVPTANQQQPHPVPAPPKVPHHPAARNQITFPPQHAAPAFPPSFKPHSAGNSGYPKAQPQPYPYQHNKPNVGFPPRG